MPLLNEASNVYLGAQSVSAVYQGDVKVWPTAKNYAAWWDFSTDSAEGWEHSAGHPLSVVDGVLTTDYVHTGTGEIATAGLLSPVLLLDNFHQYDCEHFIPYMEYMFLKEGLGAETTGAPSHMLYQPSAVAAVTQNYWGYEEVPYDTWSVTPDRAHHEYPMGIMYEWMSNGGGEAFLKSEFAEWAPPGSPVDLQFRFAQIVKDDAGVDAAYGLRLRRCGFIDADLYYNSGGQTVRPVELLGSAR